MLSVMPAKAADGGLWRRPEDGPEGLKPPCCGCMGGLGSGWAGAGPGCPCIPAAGLCWLYMPGCAPAGPGTLMEVTITSRVDGFTSSPLSKPGRHRKCIDRVHSNASMCTVEF